MKYFELCLEENNKLNEFIDEFGNIFCVEEIQEDEDHELHEELESILLNYIPLYKKVQHPQSNYLNPTHLLIFEDGSIFKEGHGCFDPVGITHDLSK